MGTVVEGVAAFGVLVEGEELLALGLLVDGVVTVWVGETDAPAEAGARAAPMAMPVPRVVATPTLAQPTKRRLREAGWGRLRRVMGSPVRMGGETGVKRG